MRLLLRDGLVLTFVGLTGGLVLAALVTPFLGMFLAGVPPHDLTSFAVVAAVLVVPRSRRAMDPHAGVCDCRRPMPFVTSDGPRRRYE